MSDEVFKAIQITSVWDEKCPQAAFSVDTVPERQVLVRTHVQQPGGPCNGWEITSYDMSPEAALKFSEDLREYAYQVMVRDVMCS